MEPLIGLGLRNTFPRSLEGRARQAPRLSCSKSRKESTTHPAKSSTVENIIQSVHAEFGDKAELFDHIVLRMDELHGTEFERTKFPGVYVFVHDEFGCVKVGKSQSNASKRALQHCGTDNTSSKDKTIEMSQFLNSDKTHLLIFALNRSDSMHWVLALENYLESTHSPKIPSKRNG